MLRIPIAVGALLLIWSTGPAAARGELPRKPILTREAARKVLRVALVEAQRLKAPGGAIAVVDDGGHLVAFERLDDSIPAGSQVSIGKAKTAALFKRPTQVFEALVNEKGRTTMVALDDFTPLQGGIPLAIEGVVVGGVGVSGAASAAQDEEIAKAAAAALGEPSAGPEVSFFDADRVRRAFAKGEPLSETATYKIHASRREGPGEAEVHERETDIFYVLEGRATFVTGGSLTHTRATGPGELRGEAVQGGERRDLGPGDLIVIPSGVPHWFQAVEGPFLYYVVKVVQ